MHGWSYDAATGEGINPRSARLHRNAVKIENGKDWVDVELPG
jgi:nitrite reductase/ring-hydroxylating ferredoxin subunit